MIYLDFNASKPADPQIVEQIKPLLHLPLNPSSTHFAGKNAKNIMEDSRQKIATSFKAHCHDIVFVSSGTESVNMAFNAFNFENIFCLQTDHECSVNHLKSHPIKVDENGLARLNELDDLLSKNANSLNLVSFCLANNQSGVMQNAGQIVAIVKKYPNTLIHADGAQYICKEHFSFANDDFDFDFLSFSSHKIGAIGAGGVLIYKSELDIRPLFYGGGQQKFKRAGTENIISAFSTALAVEKFNDKIYIKNYKQHTAKIQQELESFLTQNNCIIFAKNAPRITNTTFFAMPRFENYIQLVEYDLANICLSAGSACSSGKTGLSHVLLAMDVEKPLAACALRISYNITTTTHELAKFYETFLTLQARG